MRNGEFSDRVFFFGVKIRETYVTSTGRDCGGGCDIIEAADDAENASGPRDCESDLDANSWIKFALMRDMKFQLMKCPKRTDITPPRSPINSIPGPNDRVDEMDETSESGPNHVHARPHIPRLEMPP